LRHSTLGGVRRAGGISILPRVARLLVLPEGGMFAFARASLLVVFSFELVGRGCVVKGESV